MAETNTGLAPDFPQERARKTYQALIDAAALVFTEDGYDGTRTPDIAARAEVSVGTFYRYFTDKKQIFLEVMRRHLAMSRTEIMGQLTPERLGGTQRAETIAHAIEVLFGHMERHVKIYRLFLEMALRDEETATLHREFHSETRAGLVQLIRVLPTRPVADPDTTAFMIQSLVVESANAVLLRSDGPNADRAGVIAALTRLVHLALFSDAY